MSFNILDITLDSTPAWWWTPGMRRRFQALQEEREALRKFQDELKRSLSSHSQKDAGGEQLSGRPTNRATASGSTLQTQDDGFVMGLATGIPIPLTPQSIMGAVIHNSMTSSPSRAESYSPPAPEPERYTPSTTSTSYSSDSSSSYTSDSSSSSSSSYD